MSSGGFWPGDPPADEEEEGVVQEPTSSWPAPRPEVEATEVAPAAVVEEPEPEREAEPEPAAEAEAEAEPEPDDFVSRAFAAAERFLAESPSGEPAPAGAPEPPGEPARHVAGELDIPDGVGILEGSPSGAERTVAIVVSRFNAEITNGLLESSFGALEAAGVPRERITVMPVPGAFELPIGAMALAKTRRYSCVVALGCIVRGETPHFDFIATEAASGLQLAGLETGVPVAFGVLTVDTVEQARARTGKGAEAARAALEMADLFSQLRNRAAG